MDAVLCIAVIHHLSTRDRRLKALSELARVLRPNGRACVTVWARQQGQSAYAKMRTQKGAEDPLGQEDNAENEQGEEPLRSNNASRLQVHNGKLGDFTQPDMLVPWSSKDDTKRNTEENGTLLRYYHLFECGELASLVEQLNIDGAGRVKMISEDYEEGNWIVVFEKT